MVRDLIDQISHMMEMETNISLSEKPKFMGHLAFYMGGFFESVYRSDYKAYIPKGFDAVPGRISAAFSTNDPGTAEELKIATVGVNHVFHAVSDFFQDFGTHDSNLETFDGELTIAATRIGEETAGFLFVSTRKIFFPQTIINGLLHRLRTKIGETNYFGKEKDGEVYRIRSAKLDVPADLWVTRNTIVLCSSENAFRTFLAKPVVGPGGPAAFEEGDFFLIADPPTDPEAFLKMLPVWDNAYRFLLDIIGPVRFQATSREGKIKFSGNVTMKHDGGS